MMVARAAFTAILLWVLVFALFGPASAGEPRPEGQGWREEYEYLCSRTQEAARMGGDELKSMAERCDRLMPEVEKLEGPERKPLVRRLKMSRDFYRFMLEQKQKEGGR